MGNFKDSEYYKSGKILESAKKGSIIGLEKIQEQKNQRILEYDQNPNKCVLCDKELSYEKRKNRFCSSSCSATYNNKKRKNNKICPNCEKMFLPKRKKQKYCCKECSDKKSSERAKEPWKNEEYRKKVSDGLKQTWASNREVFSSGEKHSKIVGETTKGKYKGTDITSILDVSKRTTSKIIKRLDLGCVLCGWKESSCDIHHINGKKIENCNEHNNLTYICPNCHRLVHTGKIDKSRLISLDKILPDNWMELYYG